MGDEGTDETRQVTFISWVDFIQVEGRHYVNSDAEGSFAAGARRGLSRSDLESPYARVRFQVYGNVHEFTYMPGDGDAAFLPVGTVLYRVRDYAPAFRLAATQRTPESEQLCLYEVDSSPEAQRGGDLLDIDARVQSIRILSAEDGRTELGRIEAPGQIGDLVGMVLSAPVNQAIHEHEGTQCFLSFVLFDGTAVTRSYWPNSGELSRGILLPDAFRRAVLAGLARL